MSAHDADDLFAGPGGWDVAARDLGLETLGYELDPNACATRRATGLATIEGDVRVADPLASEARGLIASPPCQTFSMAGKGAGRGSLDRLAQALRTGWWFGIEGDDERTILVLEPYRWIYQRHAAGRSYQWIAFEQVAPVLPIWEVYAEWLRTLGYSVATGVLQAEQFGVPQTRKRAVLVARWLGDDPILPCCGFPREQGHTTGCADYVAAKLPAPTHSRYYPRSPEKLDPGVLPWVSMAEALGWGADERVGFPRQSDGVGETVEIDGVDYRARDLFPAGGPAQALTAKSRSWQRFAMGDVRSSNAPTTTAAMDNGNFQWVSDNRPNTARRDFDQPAPTILGNGERGTHATWAGQREAVRVTPAEAAVLQTFPADYPWQGSRTAQFQQVGNAVPPLLARAILAAVTA